jgi:hypothetical protein
LEPIEPAAAFLIFGSVLIVLLDRGITARLTRRALVACGMALSPATTIIMKKRTAHLTLLDSRASASDRLQT